MQLIANNRHLFCKMMMVKKNIILTMLCLASLISNGQAILKLDKKIHDFGIVKESADISCIFVLENIGTDTLFIGEIQPECGCTLPDISSKIIAPKSKSIMRVKYDGKDRLGSFSKKIAIYSNSNPKVEILFIMGEVQTDGVFNQALLRTNAAVQLNMDRLVFGEVDNQSKKTVAITFYNNSEKEQMVLGFNNKPEWIMVEMDTAKILAKKSVSINFTMDASKIKDFGKIIRYFSVRTSDPTEPAKMIFVNAIITEHFEKPPTKKKKLDKWNSMQPKASLSRKLIDYGNIRSGAVAKDTLSITNTGGDTLFIRKIESTCACLKVEVSKYKLAPGETAVFTVIFDSITRKELQRKSASIYVNDPNHSEIVISTTAQVIN